MVLEKATKEIFILPGNTDLNRGDQALVWETIRLVKEVVPDATFVLFQSGTKDSDVFLQSRQTHGLGHSIVPKILKHPSRINNSGSNEIKYTYANYFLWGLRGLGDLISSSLLLFPSRLLNRIGIALMGQKEKDVIERFKNSYAVVVKGGGFIHSYGRATDFYTLYFILFHILLAIRFNKKVIVLPNSVGPVEGALSKRLVNYLLDKCQVITVRENVSKKYLKQQFGLDSRIYPDLGFYLTSTVNNKSKEYLIARRIPLGEKKIIGFTLRPYRFPNSIDPIYQYKKYLAELSCFISFLIKDGNHIVLFAHTLGPSSHEDDRIALKSLLDMLPSELLPSVSYEENIDVNCVELMEMYSHLDLMVGTRFHSVIFALNVNVPCIAIGYGGNKSFGIMEDMNLSEFVFPIENFTSLQLRQAYLKINDGRELYLKEIRTYRNYLNSARAELVMECENVLNEKKF